jgi:hypothetical protein
LISVGSEVQVFPGPPILDKAQRVGRLVDGWFVGEWWV